jgi:hypothetical protein
LPNDPHQADGLSEVTAIVARGTEPTACRYALMQRISLLV